MNLFLKYKNEIKLCLIDSDSYKMIREKKITLYVRKGRTTFYVMGNAAQKYNILAQKHFGQFARLNQFTDKEKMFINEKYVAKHISIAKNNTTGYRGVSLSSNIRQVNRYVATIYYNGKNHQLGCFQDAKSAAIVYNKAAIKFHGEKAFQNKL